MLLKIVIVVTRITTNSNYRSQTRNHGGATITRIFIVTISGFKNITRGGLCDGSSYPTPKRTMLVDSTCNLPE